MKIGYTTSLIGHSLLIGWGLVSLPSPDRLEASQIEALPVDLVSITDVTNLSEGARNAPERETASPAEIPTPTRNPDSDRAGAAEQDQSTPPTPEATNTPAQAANETPPPPPPPPPPAPEVEAEPEPVEETPDVAEAPQAEPVPEQTIEDIIQPAREVGELAPEPAARDEEEEPEEASPPPIPADVRPRSRPAPPERQVAETPPQPEPPARTEPRAQETTDFNPDDIASLLNRVDPSGGGGRSSPDPASFGSPSGQGQVEMTQSEIDALRAQISACWNPPIGATAADDLRVRVGISLNRDGSLAGNPQILDMPNGNFAQVAAESASRAIRRCQPYTLPAEKYDAWADVNITFDPANMF